MTLDEFMADEDWAIVFSDPDSYKSDGPREMVPPGTSGDPNVRRSDVVEILHEWSVSGRCYADWTGVMVGRLSDGRFVAASGWSDSSGWG